jgi:hypothetical protein
MSLARENVAGRLLIRLGSAALLLLVMGLGRPALAGVCIPFCPARQDIGGLLQPIIVVSGDLDEQGSLDLVAVSEQIPGDLTKGSVTVFLADGTGDFFPVSYLVIDGSPQSAALGDFNRDNHLDLAVAHFLSYGISILLGDGTGSFTTTLTHNLSGQPVALAATEFTGDTDEDLIVVTSPLGFPGTAHVLQGAGNGTFVEIATAGTDTDPRDVLVDDFNQDTVPDIAVANRLGQSVTIIPGAGAGSLGTPATLDLGASARTLSSGDINNDLKLDLVAGGDTVGSSVIPLFGDGSGGFTPGTPVALGSDIPSLDVCDYDMDGNLDVVAAKFTADSVSLLRGKGNGSFDPATALGANARPRFVHSTDLNSDGFCDSVSANQAGGSLSLFLADGLGNIGTPSFTTGTTPLSVAAEDLNGDSRPDVVSADRDSNTVSVFFGDGEGGMTLTQILSSGPNPGAVVIQDLSGDGTLDIAVANQGVPGSQQSSTVTIFFGDGFGNFPGSTTLTAGRLPLDIISEDFDGDTLFDLAVANGDSDNVSIFRSAGNGSFRPRKNFSVGEQPRSLAVLDVDDDTIPDIAVSQGMDNTIGFLMGDGDGTFSLEASTLPGAALNVDELIAADLDGDGFQDLAWIDQKLVNEPASVSVYLHDGVAWFIQAPSSDLPTGTFAEGLVATDLDRRDGVDLVVANRFDDTAQVYYGDGTGLFTDEGTFGAGHEPFAIAVADFNRDGREDIVTADFNGDSVSILLNNTFIDPGFKSVYAISQTSFAWDPVPGATIYRVYRGEIGLLRSREYGTCLTNNAVSAFSDTLPLLPGEIVFYIVTPVVGGEEGSMGVTSGCLKRVNRHPCPL